MLKTCMKAALAMHATDMGYYATLWVRQAAHLMQVIKEVRQVLNGCHSMGGVHQGHRRLMAPQVDNLRDKGPATT